MFDKWHVAFYGTMIGRLRRILDLGHIPLQGNHAFTPYVWSVWTAATPVLYSVVSFFGNVNHMFSAVHTAVQYTELLSAYHSPKHFSSYLRGKTEFL